MAQVVPAKICDLRIGHGNIEPLTRIEQTFAFVLRREKHPLVHVFPSRMRVSPAPHSPANNAPDLTLWSVRRPLAIWQRKQEKVRGVYEKIPGSGIWWCRYADSRGILHRERVGRRSDAIDLYNKRRTEALQRKKLPERFRAKGITFRTLCADALEHSRATNSGKSTYELELKINELLPVFGDMRAEDITKQDIVRWLTTEATRGDGNHPAATVGRLPSR